MDTFRLERDGNDVREKKPKLGTAFCLNYPAWIPMISNRLKKLGIS